MLKHDILIGNRASNKEYIHQTLYLHVDIGFSYYLIVHFGEMEGKMVKGNAPINCFPDGGGGG